MTTSSSLSATAGPTARDARMPGLDGLRAIAVLVVIVYHVFPGVGLSGGFIGVDVFFVISGFLITTLLIGEHARTGRIGLVAFWRRRARRLLPALALLITVCATAAWLVGGDVLVGIGRQVLGAATFSYNWVAIASGTSYFSATESELFRNLWSLAVEEQFYLLWPLLLPLLFLLPRAWARVVVAASAAAASAGWMAVVAADGDPTRAYYGTGTHAFALLIGVALAFGARRVLEGGAVRGRRTVGVLGWAAVAGILVIATIPPGDTAATFPGAMLAASVLTAVAILAGIWPTSSFGRQLDRPLRWIGERSYGLYLWHWPLLVLLVAAFEGTTPESGVPVWTGVLVLALTVGAAALSYRYVETPIRRDGFRATVRRLRDGLAGGPRTRVRALGVATTTVLLLGGTSAALADAPARTGAETIVSAGERALQDAATAMATPAPSSSSSVTPSPTATATAAPSPAPGPVTNKTRPSPTPTTVAADGRSISAVGDSVMLAAVPALLERLPGIRIDAAVSRSTWAGPRVLETFRAEGDLRRFVVIALGTNGPVDRGSLERMAAIAGPTREVILVNAYAPRDWIAGVNADLAEFARERENVTVADWSGAIADRPELLAADRVHPGDEAARIFADTVAAAVQQIDQRIATERYERQLRVYEAIQAHPQPIGE